MVLINYSWSVEGKYRFFAYLSIIIPIGGFLLIPFLEASSSSPSYNGIVPGWQNTLISLYAISMVTIWILTSIYYSNVEAKKGQI